MGCKHYKGRGLMKEYANLGELATEYGIPLANIEETRKEYNEVADKIAKDPENGPYDAYGGGEAAGGIHGTNRLGGNSLLDCVVYGRVSGRSAARHMMAYNIKAIEAAGAPAMSKL